MKLFKTPRFFRIFFPNKTWGFSRSEKAVYLTFDDGPDPDITPWVLDFLKEKDIQATFFCVGENVKNNPAIYARILAEGHAVGNHSMKHEKGVKTALKEYLHSIESAKEYIDSKLFRPPYGRMTFSQTHQVKMNYDIIMWSWLSFDYDKNIPVEKILRKAKKQLKAGDILVLHDNAKTKDRLKILLPEIVAIIGEKELKFKRISPNSERL